MLFLYKNNSERYNNINSCTDNSLNKQACFILFYFYLIFEFLFWPIKRYMAEKRLTENKNLVKCATDLSVSTLKDRTSMQLSILRPSVS